MAEQSPYLEESIAANHQQFPEQHQRDRVIEMGAPLGGVATHSLLAEAPANGRCIEFHPVLNARNNQIVYDHYGNDARTLTLLPYAQVEIDGYRLGLKPPKGPDNGRIRQILLGAMIDLRGGYVRLSDIKEYAALDISNTPPFSLAEHLRDANGQRVIELLRHSARLTYYRFAPDVIVVDAQGGEAYVDAEIPTIQHRDPFAPKPPKAPKPKKPKQAQLRSVQAVAQVMEPQAAQDSHIEAEPEEEVEHVFVPTIVPSKLYDALCTIKESFGFDQNEFRALRYQFDDTPIGASRRLENPEIIELVADAVEFMQEYEQDVLSTPESTVLGHVLGDLDGTPLRLSLTKSEIAEQMKIDAEDVPDLLAEALYKLASVRDGVRAVKDMPTE